MSVKSVRCPGRGWRPEKVFQKRARAEDPNGQERGGGKGKFWTNIPALGRVWPVTKRVDLWGGVAAAILFGQRGSRDRVVLRESGGADIPSWAEGRGVVGEVVDCCVCC